MLPAVVASLFAVTAALASPVSYLNFAPRAGPAAIGDTNTTYYNDVDIFQLAIYLENLENAFFEYGASKFSAQDYISAGYPSYAPGRVSQAAAHDVVQTKFLKDVLGPNHPGVPPCTYDFSGLTTPQLFLTEAAKLKQVVSSAYTGSLQYITTPFARATGSIAVVEAREQAFIEGTLLKGAPWTGPLDSYLGLDESYSFTQGYIVSCPANATQNLPFKTFPVLSVNGGYGGVDGAAGATVKLSYNSTKNATGPLFLNVANGLGQTNVPITNGSVTLPAGLQGWTFLIVTTDSTPVNMTTDSYIAGPAFYHTVFDSSVNNTGFMTPTTAAFT